LDVRLCINIEASEWGEGMGDAKLRIKEKKMIFFSHHVRNLKIHKT
jgi:hypothetical protein